MKSRSIVFGAATLIALSLGACRTDRTDDTFGEPAYEIEMEERTIEVPTIERREPETRVDTVRVTPGDTVRIQ
jgi:hypothetical protein